MAGENVLREFLVRLGFKVDDATYKRFTDSITTVTKSVAQLGLTVEGAALGIEALALRFASAGDKMYWNSRRIGDSVQHIERFKFAISQVGGSAEGAESSVRTFADKVAMYGPRFASGLGLDPTKYHGTVELFDAILHRLSTMPEAVRRVRGQFLGADLDTLLAGGRDTGRWEHFYDRVQKSAGLNQDKVAALSMRLQQNVRSLQLVGKTLAWKVFSDIAEKHGPDFERFVTQLVDNLPNLARQIEHVLDQVLKLSKAINDLVQQYGGWKTVAEGIIALKFAGWAADFVAALATIAASPAFASLMLLFTTGLAFYNLTRQVIEQPDNQPETAPGKLPAGRKDRIGIVNDYLSGKGFSDAQVAGILSNLISESQLNPAAENEKGMYGIAQWDKSRQALFKQVMGHDIHGSSLSDQLDFIVWELGHSELAAGSQLKGAKNARMAAIRFGHDYERFTDAELSGALLGRGALAESIYNGTFLGAGGAKHGETNVTNTVTNNVTSSDPQAAGKATGTATEAALNRFTARMLSPRVR